MKTFRDYLIAKSYNSSLAYKKNIKLNHWKENIISSFKSC